MRIITALLVLVFSVLAQAEGLTKQSFKEGEHYVRLATPVKTADPNKIEVTEFFWYGCGHCYNFEPLLQKWLTNLPEEIGFTESPVMWQKNMETHARIFYTSKVLGVLDVMHRAVFDAMHIKQMKLERPKQIQTLYEQNGVSGSDFEKAFNSFSVESAVKQANARARNYGITGTPEIVVDGTYRVSGSMAGSQTNMLAVAEYLACKIYAEKPVAQSAPATETESVAADADKPNPMASFCDRYAI